VKNCWILAALFAAIGFSTPGIARVLLTGPGERTPGELAGSPDLVPAFYKECAQNVILEQIRAQQPDMGLQILRGTEVLIPCWKYDCFLYTFSARDKNNAVFTGESYLTVIRIDRQHRPTRCELWRDQSIRNTCNAANSLKIKNAEGHPLVDGRVGSCRPVF